MAHRPLPPEGRLNSLYFIAYARHYAEKLTPASVQHPDGHFKLQKYDIKKDQKEKGAADKQNSFSFLSRLASQILAAAHPATPLLLHQG